jgi:hypothetical protein
MGNIASPWRYDAAASHARAPLKHPIAYDLALRPRAAIFQCHGRLDGFACAFMDGAVIGTPSVGMKQARANRYSGEFEP